MMMPWYVRRFFMNLWGYLVGIGIGVVVSTARLFRQTGSDVVQVRLSPDGVRQGNRGIGPVPYEANADARLVPWTEVGHVEIQRAGDGERRLTLASTASWWKLRPAYVGAVVRCSPEAAVALRQRIHAWRATARSL